MRDQTYISFLVSSFLNRSATHSSSLDFFLFPGNCEFVILFQKSLKRHNWLKKETEKAIIRKVHCFDNPPLKGARSRYFR